jgi:hypothetical protein
VAKETFVFAQLTNPFRSWRHPMHSGVLQPEGTPSASLEPTQTPGIASALMAWGSLFRRRRWQRHSDQTAFESFQAIGATDAELARLRGPGSTRTIDEARWSGAYVQIGWKRYWW